MDTLQTTPARHDALTQALLTGQSPLGRPQALLAFYPGQYLLAYDEGRIRHLKMVSEATVQAAFAGLATDTGWLPAGVVRWGSDTQGTFLVRWIPPAIHTLPIILLGRRVVADLQVPLPGLILVGHARRYWCWATRTADFDPEARIYAAPLPNIMPGGRVCWGPTNTPPEAAAATFESVWRLFTTAPFNDHVANGKSVMFPGDVRPMLERLADEGAATYPTADLVAYTPAISVQDAVAAALKAEESR